MQIIDLNVMFSASNYFDVVGLVCILISLLMTLPQNNIYSISLLGHNDHLSEVILKEQKHFSDIAEIDRALKQAFRFAEYKRRIS